MALYSVIPSMAGRSAVMMLSGYLSFYCAEYTGTFTCSTIGALGGAVFMTAFGWADVGTIAAVRLGYVCAGAALAVAANCLLFPYRRGTATRQLLKKYTDTTELLAKVCGGREVDTQLYYSLVIQAHLLEAKLIQNARAAGWGGPSAGWRSQLPVEMFLNALVASVDMYGDGLIGGFQIPLFKAFNDLLVLRVGL